MGMGQIFGAIVGVEVGHSGGVVLRTPKDAQVLARRIFEGLTKGLNDCLIVSDFYPYFSSIDEAKAAFQLFDPDGNGDVNKAEMKAAVLKIFRDRQALNKSLHSSSQAVDKLDSIFKIVAYIIIFFIALSLLSIDTTKFLTGFISLWAGLVFAGIL
jgi:hypothetical protein